MPRIAGLTLSFYRPGRKNPKAVCISISSDNQPMSSARDRYPRGSQIGATGTIVNLRELCGRMGIKQVTDGKAHELLAAKPKRKDRHA
jgi:hypothetical protein